MVNFAIIGLLLLLSSPPADKADTLTEQLRDKQGSHCFVQVCFTG